MKNSLDKAIALHAKHKSGKAPTSPASQKKMMLLMKAAKKEKKVK